MISVVATVQCDMCGHAILVPCTASWNSLGEIKASVFAPSLWTITSGNVECPYCKHNREQKKGLMLQ